jgi:ubiquinone/menaquinone biosynthesis C-methylase UbiE
MSDPEQWQVSGNAPQAYERYMVPTLFTPWAQELLARAALHAGERVLDVACGTGIVARLAAQRVGPSGYVMGVDLNAAMIETARTQTPPAGAPVEWREGDAHALPCADATFDVVCCQQGLQFFPDKPHALREMHRVLGPGGRLVLSVWRSLPYNPYGRALADAMERHVGAAAGTGMPAPYGFGEMEPLRTLLTAAGFRDIHIHIVVLTMRHPTPAEFIAGQLAATPLAGAVAALDAAAQVALRHDILASLRPYTDDEGLAVPIEAHIAMAQREHAQT